MLPLFRRLTAISAIFVSLTLASPAAKPDLEARAQNNCAAVDFVVSVLHAPAIQSTVTGFCSSFLGIPVLTSTITTTASTTISTPVYTTTSTLIVTSSAVTISTPVDITATTTVTSTSTSTTVATVTTTVTLGLPKKKRDLAIRAPAIPPKPSVPAALKIFADNLISSACSCLSIPTSTAEITVTSTKTATVPGSTIISTITSISTSAYTVDVPGSTVTDTVITVTSTASAVTSSTVTSTVTVLGVASQCLGAAISASPVNLQNPGQMALAGTAEKVGHPYPADNLQDCCSNCYLAVGGCLAFSFGNIDNEQNNFPPVLDNPSNVNTCRIYRDPFNSCAADVTAFNTGEPALSGEVNNFGFGPCRPSVM